MNLSWYLYRLGKMGPAEVAKRLAEYLALSYSRLKYRQPGRWPYSRFARPGMILVIHDLPGSSFESDWGHYRVFNNEFDLSKPLDWNFSESDGVRWPCRHYAGIPYRPGNPYGDVRINWELNRLQFLPQLALVNEDLARDIIVDWMDKNPFLYGPGYLSSMEVALRWFSIYRAVCLFKQPLEVSLSQNLTGLAIASGRFISSRLSTHSSAGNHLIVEAVGLFWIGKALEQAKFGRRLKEKARKILWPQILRQIHPDGGSGEQTFWYLGFVLDAFFHYFLLEDRAKIPATVLDRVQKSLEFINDLTMPNGHFPDYGDRDDGFVFRSQEKYYESPFPGLLSLGAVLFDRPEWSRPGLDAERRPAFWTGETPDKQAFRPGRYQNSMDSDKPRVRSFRDAGLTLMERGQGRLILRHGPLGFGKTCGHGHADALSVLFYWDGTPVLIDLGSGQYNGDQSVRNFFRSTLAHNTIEIGGRDQAKMLGPFMWEKSYEAGLASTKETPTPCAEAWHNGYQEVFGVTHTRKVEWPAENGIVITDNFTNPRKIDGRGAFHFAPCRSIEKRDNVVEADFGGFLFRLELPAIAEIALYYGSENPFIGWRSTVYGRWEPINSVVFQFEMDATHSHQIKISIV